MGGREGGPTYSSTVVELWLSSLIGQRGNTLVDWTRSGKEGEGEKSGEAELHSRNLFGCLGWW